MTELLAADFLFHHGPGGAILTFVVLAILLVAFLFIRMTDES